MQQIPVSLLTLIAGVLITMLSIWVGQHHGLLPTQASAQAPLVDGFFNTMLSIATALFLVIEGTIIIFLFKYRRRKGDDTDGVYVEGNFPLEVFWTAIPAIIVIGLGIYSVDVYNEMGGFDPGNHHNMAHVHTSSQMASMPGSAMASTLEDASETEDDETVAPAATAKLGIGAAPTREGKPADLVVNVSGVQFAWIFNYPNDDIATGELHVPVGADVQLNLSATDVIHSFWVPQFRLKQDAIPGIPTELRFVATKTGTYPIVCAELCGGYHGSMRSQVVVHTPEEFASWLEENREEEEEEELEEASAGEFLAPYTKNLGINSEVLAQLQNS